MKALHPLKLAVAILLATSFAAGDADAQRRSSKRDEPKALYPDATRQDPGGSFSQRLAKPIERLQKAYGEDGKEEQAIAAAQEIINSDRAKDFDKAMAYLLGGSAANDLGQDDVAAEYLSKAIELNALSNDNHYSAMMSLGSVYLNSDRFEEAAAVIKRLIDETKTQDPQVYMLLGGAYYNAGDYAQAIAPLKQALALDTEGKLEQVPAMLMQSYSETGDEAAAIGIAEEMVRRNPEDKRSLLNLAALYGNNDQADKAVALLEQAKTKGLLSTADDYRRLYSTYYSMQREKDAAAVIEEGLAKGLLPKDGQTYTILAQSLYFSDNIEGSISAAKTGAPLADNGDLALFLAQVLGQEDRNAEAKEAGRLAISKGIANPGEAWMVIARAEFYSDNIPGARQAYQEAAKDPKTAEQARKALAQISR